MEFLQTEDDDWRIQYMAQFMMDVTNIKECVLFIIFIIIALILFYKIFSDLRYMKYLYIRRCNEKIDIIEIKLILLLDIIFQIFTYLVECIGLSLLQNCQDNNYFITTILSFFGNIGYVICIQICCWKSILIWGHLLCLKLQKSTHLFNFLKKTFIGEIIILTMNIIGFIFFFTKTQGIIYLLISLLSTLIMIIFIIISILFQKYILIQSEIPSITRRRVQISSIILIIAFSLRVAWNLIQIIPGTKDGLMKLKHDKDWEPKDCSEPNSNSWFIYNIFYISIVNLLPVFLFNRIYSPQRNIIQSKVNRLIDDDDE